MTTPKGGKTVAGFSIPDSVKEKKIGIAVATWNNDITDVLLAGAEDCLQKNGILNYVKHHIPGSFELPLAAKYLIEYGNADAVICIGCLIKGDTPHFHYISESVSLTLNQLSVLSTKPVIFGVLTVDTHEQAKERAGGKLGNKGYEAAEAAIQMLITKENIKEEARPKQNIGFGKK